MGLLNFKSRRLKIPKDYKYKDNMISEDEDSLMLIFERKSKKRGSK